MHPVDKAKMFGHRFLLSGHVLKVTMIKFLRIGHKEMLPVVPSLKLRYLASILKIYPSMNQNHHKNPKSVIDKGKYNREKGIQG